MCTIQSLFLIDLTFSDKNTKTNAILEALFIFPDPFESVITNTLKILNNLIKLKSQQHCLFTSLRSESSLPGN
jgi:hypothetical protein